MAIRMVALLCLWLTACTKPVYAPRGDIPPAPAYPVRSLQPGDPPDKVGKAYIASLHGCIVYSEQLQYLLTN